MKPDPLDLAKMVKRIVGLSESETSASGDNPESDGAALSQGQATRIVNRSLERITEDDDKTLAKLWAIHREPKPGSGESAESTPVDQRKKENSACSITEREPLEPSVEERRRWVRTKLESAEDY